MLLKVKIPKLLDYPVSIEFTNICKSLRIHSDEVWNRKAIRQRVSAVIQFDICFSALKEEMLILLSLGNHVNVR